MLLYVVAAKLWVRGDSTQEDFRRSHHRPERILFQGQNTNIQTLFEANGTPRNDETLR